MRRRCPNCKSVNVRRSSREPDNPNEPRFRSPYRCRDCQTKFWAISSRVYKLIALIAGVNVVLLGAIMYFVSLIPDTPRWDSIRRNGSMLERPRTATAELTGIWRKV